MAGILDDINVRFNLQTEGSVQGVQDIEASVSALSGSLDSARATATSLLQEMNSIMSTVQALGSQRMDIIPESTVSRLREVQSILSGISGQSVGLNIGGGGGGFGGGSGGGGAPGGGGGGFGTGGGDALQSLRGMMTATGALATMGTIASVGGQGKDWYSAYTDMFQMFGGEGSMAGAGYGFGTVKATQDYKTSASNSLEDMMMIAEDQGYGMDVALSTMAQGGRAGGVRAMGRDTDAGEGDLFNTAIKWGRLMAMDPAIIANIAGTVYSVTGYSPEKMMTEVRETVRGSGRTGQQGQITQDLATILTSMRQRGGFMPEGAEATMFQTYKDALGRGSSLQQAMSMTQVMSQGASTELGQFMELQAMSDMGYSMAQIVIGGDKLMATGDVTKNVFEDIAGSMEGVDYKDSRWIASTPQGEKNLAFAQAVYDPIKGAIKNDALYMPGMVNEEGKQWYPAVPGRYNVGREDPNALELSPENIKNQALSGIYGHDIVQLQELNQSVMRSVAATLEIENMSQKILTGVTMLLGGDVSEEEVKTLMGETMTEFFTGSKGGNALVSETEGRLLSVGEIVGGSMVAKGVFQGVTGKAKVGGANVVAGAALLGASALAQENAQKNIREGTGNFGPSTGISGSSDQPVTQATTPGGAPIPMGANTRYNVETQIIVVLANKE